MANLFKHSLTKKTTLAFLICSLLFACGFVRRSGSLNMLNEIDRLREDNNNLKSRIKQLEAANKNEQKDTKKSEAEKSASKIKIQQLQATNDQQQAALAALRTKIKQLETTNANQLKKIQQVENLSSKAVAVSNISLDQSQIVKISEPFFGIYLGEKIDQLQTRITLDEIPQQDSSLSLDIKTFSLQPTDPNISKIIVRSFKGNVYQLSAIFKDASPQHFESLKKQYKQTYGPQPDLGSTALFPGDKAADFLPVVNGTQIKISILYTQTSQMAMTCIHKPLENKLMDELAQLDKNQYQVETKAIF